MTARRSPQETLRDAQRLLELDEKATPGPWLIRRQVDEYPDEDEDEEPALMHPEHVGPFYVPEHEKTGTGHQKDIDQVETDYALLSESRTLSPALARDCVGLIEELTAARDCLIAEGLRVNELAALWDLCRPLCCHVPEVAAKARELGLIEAPSPTSGRSE